MPSNRINTLAKVFLLAALLPLVAMILRRQPLTETQAIMTWVLGAAMFTVWQWQAMLLVVCLFRGGYPKA